MLSVLLSGTVSQTIVGTEKICFSVNNECDSGFTKVTYKEGDILSLLPTSIIQVKESITTPIAISKAESEQQISITISGVSAATKLSLICDFKIDTLSLQDIDLNLPKDTNIIALTMKKSVSLENPISVNNLQIENIIESSALINMVKEGGSNQFFKFIHDNDIDVTLIVDKKRSFLYNNPDKQITIKSNDNFDFNIEQNAGSLSIKGINSVIEEEMLRYRINAKGGVVKFLEYEWYDEREFENKPIWDMTNDDNYMCLYVYGPTEIRIAAIDVPVKIQNTDSNKKNTLNIICEKPYTSIVGKLITAVVGDKVSNGGLTGEVEFSVGQIEGPESSLVVDENVYVSVGMNKNDASITQFANPEKKRYNFYEYIGEKSFENLIQFSYRTNIGLYIPKSGGFVIPKITLNHGLKIPQGGKVTLFFRMKDLRDDDKDQMPEAKSLWKWLSPNTIFDSKNAFNPDQIKIKIFHLLHSPLQYEIKYIEMSDNKFCYTWRMTETPNTLPFSLNIIYTDKDGVSPSTDKLYYKSIVVKSDAQDVALSNQIKAIEKQADAVSITLDVAQEYIKVLNLDDFPSNLKSLSIKTATSEKRSLKLKYTEATISKIRTLEINNIDLDIESPPLDASEAINMKFETVKMYNCEISNEIKKHEIKFGDFTSLTDDTYRLIYQKSSFVNMNLSFTQDYKLIEFHENKYVVKLDADPDALVQDTFDILGDEKITGQLNFLPKFNTMNIILENKKKIANNVFNGINILDPTVDEDSSPTVTFSGDAWNSAEFSAPISIISNKKLTINNFPPKASLQNMFMQRTPRVVVTTSGDYVKIDGSKPYKDDQEIWIEDGKSVHIDNFLFNGYWPSLKARDSNNEYVPFVFKTANIMNGGTGAFRHGEVSGQITINKDSQLFTEKLTFNPDSEIIFNFDSGRKEVPRFVSKEVVNKPKALKLKYVGDNKNPEKLLIDESLLVAVIGLTEEDAKSWFDLIEKDEQIKDLKFSYGSFSHDNVNYMGMFISGSLKNPPPPPLPPPIEEDSQKSNENSQGGYIALLSISCIAIVVIVIVAIYLFIFKKKKDDNNIKENDDTSPNGDDV